MYPCCKKESELTREGTERHVNTGELKDNPNPECKYPIIQLLFIGLPLASLWDYPFTVLTSVIDSSYTDASWYLQTALT